MTITPSNVTAAITRTEKGILILNLTMAEGFCYSQYIQKDAQWESAAQLFGFFCVQRRATSLTLTSQGLRRREKLLLFYGKTQTGCGDESSSYHEITNMSK